MAAFLFFFTHGAFATMIPSSEWAPGGNCYTDSTKYKIAVCDCIGYQGSNGTALPECDTNSPTSDICLMGTKTELFHYSGLHGVIPDCMSPGGNGNGESRAVKYVCFDRTTWSDADSVCDCADYITDWVQGSETSSNNNRYTRTTATFQCGTYDFSTYCEYQMMDPETYEYTTYSQGTTYTGKKNYVCGPAALNQPKTEYACTPGYYLATSTCKSCPDDTTSIDGITLVSTSADYNQGNLLSCYVPASSFSIPDDTGTWTWGNDCYYSY